MVESIYAHWALTGDTVLKNVKLSYDSSSGKILEIQSDQELPEKLNGKTTILIPGLLNGHCHLELYTPDPVPVLDGEGMADWANKIIQINITGTEETRTKSCQRNIQELLSTGCTFVNDISTTGTSTKPLIESGMRGKVCLEYFHPSHQPTLESIQEITQRFQQFQQQFPNHSRVQMGLSPHAPYNVSTSAYQFVIEQIKPDWVHTHVAESQDEEDWFMGKRPNGIDQVHEKFMQKVFGPEYPEKRHLAHITPAMEMTQKWTHPAKWVMAHGCFLTDEELEIFSQLQATLAHCPISNDVLKHPPLDLISALSKNVAVCFGTDSRCSNPQLDLRAEARVAISRGLSPEKAFKLLTNEGAKALDQNHLGELKPGFDCDIVLWETPVQVSEDTACETFFDPQLKAQQTLIQGKNVYQK